MKNEIRQIVLANGRLAVPSESLSDTADLYEAGLTSHASVTLMLALEEELDLEFPDHLLTREVFSSIEAIANAVAGLRPVTAS